MYRYIFIVSLLCVTVQPAWGYDESVARQSWLTVSQVERANGIPRGLLHSMSLVETGQGLEGFILPWPYTIGVNSPGKTTYSKPQSALNDIAYWEKIGFSQFDVTVAGKNYGRVKAIRARTLVNSAKPDEVISVRAHNFAKRFQTHVEAASFGENIIRLGYKNIDVGLMQINWRYHGEHFSSIFEALSPRSNANYAVEYLRSHDGDTWWDKVGRYHSGKKTHARRYIDLVWQMYKKVHRIS